ncbi:polysaccharide lyase family 8 protein [Planoprotostelium fungivorum]|uniref:Polysaccharide lyase family 8 protein n=1 Tax=Planoprotostelium fungivorum TaxID=1890364 RepID=A0A2P6N6Q8_9EUKA|nr:polysaccharide lyase family 8 protein [Planoprotostelium fungivorum]
MTNESPLMNQNELNVDVSQQVTCAAKKSGVFLLHFSVSREDMRLHLLLGLYVALVVADDGSTLASVRARVLQQSLKTVSNAATFVNNINSTGAWKDIDYTSGCVANTVTWPAAGHWDRIGAMAAVWYKTGNISYLTATKSAMKFWFDRDYTASDCTWRGGKGNCPCGTPGFWCTNWWFQVLSLSNRAGAPCALLGDKNALDASSTSHCITMTNRGTAYVFDPTSTGANLGDAVQACLLQGTLTSNLTLIRSCLVRFNSGVDYTTYADGIQRDGTFFQHGTQPYAGGYGTDFLASLGDIWTTTTGSVDLQPAKSEQDAATKYLQAIPWMSYYRDTKGYFCWDNVQVGRGITRGPEKGRMSLDLVTLASVTSEWSTGTQINSSLQLLNGNRLKGVNPTGLIGNRVFWYSDYLTHRGANYVITLKMLSNRTLTGECTNNEGTKSLHYSDGVVYNYVEGDEYVNGPALWDWYTLPGVTVDPSSHTLDCAATKFPGKSNFVGSASDGKRAVSTMDYISPINSQLSYKKSWFFFEDVYVVMTTDIVQSQGYPVVTSLDQRALSDNVRSDSGSMTGTNRVYTWIHQGKMGYVFPAKFPLNLNVSTANVTGNFLNSGVYNIPAAQAMFKPLATVTPGNPLVYIAVPGMDFSTFDANRASITQAIQILRSTKDIHAVQHVERKIIAAAFRSSVTLVTPSYNLTAGAPCALLFDYGNPLGISLTVADPTQQLSSVALTLNGSGLRCGSYDATITCTNSTGNAIKLSVKLPSGGYAGQSKTILLSGDTDTSTSSSSFTFITSSTLGSTSSSDPATATSGTMTTDASHTRSGNAMRDQPLMAVLLFAAVLLSCLF